MAVHDAMNNDHHIAHPLKVHWYIVCGIVAGSLAFLVGVTACVYRCYRNRSDAFGSNRLSSAIKKGLETVGSSMKKSPSMRSTGSTKSTGSSGSGKKQSGPETPLLHRPEDGKGSKRDALSPTGQSSDPTQQKTACTMENETKKTDGAISPSEKDVCLREKSEDEQKMRTLGSLYFHVEYDKHKNALVVTVVKATDLPAKDPALGTSDPYVKLQVLPDKRHKVKTRVLRKTLNPVYDESFTFYGIDYNQLAGLTLHFVTLSFDRFSRDDVIGEILYPLAGLDLVEHGPLELCKDITPRHIKMHSAGRGELLVSLCHQPAANRLTVVVLKARNLPKMDITGLSGDPYVKIYLLYNGQRIAKKKTHVKKRTLNPVFNESFLFDVPCNEGLQNIALEFLLLDWDRMTKNEVIGRLEIGGGAKGPTPSPETAHWNEVMNCPRKQIADWHKLKG